MADITSSFFTLFLRIHNWNSTRGKPCGDGLHFLSFWPFWAFISFHFGLLGFQFPFFCLLGLDFLSFWLLGTGWICEHLCTRRVSLRYRYGYRFGTGENVRKKKEQFQALHANMKELILIVFQDIARYRFW